MPHARQEGLLNLPDIASYVDLQSTVLAAFRREMSNVMDWSLLLDLPRKGEISAAGGKWRFEKHGLGVRFVEIETGVIVDVDSKIAEAPSAISAGRLAQYLQSKWKIEVPVAWLNRDLELLTEQGFLTRLPRSNLFVLAKPQ